MHEVLVGRQPIYSRTLDVVAYELLFRNSYENRARVTNGDEATGQLLLNALVEIGLENLVGNRLAFINFTRRYLTDDSLLPLDKAQIVLEVLEDIEPDDELVESLRRVAAAGYHVALDDFTFSEKHAALVDVARTVKLDVRALNRQQLQEHVHTLRQRGVPQLLAEKVETREDFDYCHELGFDLFQGYFLSKPQIVAGKTLPGNRMVALQLLSELQDPQVRVEQLETIVGRDVTLSFKLLQCVNSSAIGLRRKVESIRQAIMLLGFDRLRMLVSLITLTSFDDTPPSVMTAALVRGKMCELLARGLKREDASSFYLVGMFSLLDVLLSRPLAEIINALHLTDEVKTGILDLTGVMGDVLRCVIAVERTEWDGTGPLKLTASQIQQAYLQAIAAVQQSQAAISEFSQR